tara:strand:- start:1618 stop:2052 length:435 start_codon:yes stop_codon:yes gene_type:complete
MQGNVLWIEVPAHAVSGGSGNQIDIPNDAGRLFFNLTPGQQYREYITIKYKNNAQRKIMDWRGSDKWNQQFRINLLTTNQGGPNTYKDTVLKVTLLQSNPIIIDTLALSPTDPEVGKLMQASRAKGQIWDTLPGQANSRRWGII